MDTEAGLQVVTISKSITSYMAIFYPQPGLICVIKRNRKINSPLQIWSDCDKLSISQVVPLVSTGSNASPSRAGARRYYLQPKMLTNKGLVCIRALNFVISRVIKQKHSSGSFGGRLSVKSISQLIHNKVKSTLNTSAPLVSTGV